MEDTVRKMQQLKDKEKEALVSTLQSGESKVVLSFIFCLILCILCSIASLNLRLV